MFSFCFNSHADHGRVLRDIGLEMGPSQATDSSERLSGGATPHVRSQRPSDNQNREAVAEAPTLASDYGIERQRLSCRTSADGGTLSIHIPADGDYGRVRLKDPELRISETNCGARPNSSRKNCVASCEMLLNDRDHHLEKTLVSQGKTSAIQLSNTGVTQPPSNENSGPHDRPGCPKAPPESSTPDLKAVVSVSTSDAHRKPALSEQLVRQSSHGRSDGLDCHGLAEERVGGAGKTYASSGGARSHSPTDRHEVGERRTHGDCDGFASKRDSKEPLVVSDKLEDAPVEFPRSRFSKSSPCKNPGENVARIIGSQYSIVSSTSADLKSDESAKSVTKAHHVTTWSAPDGRRPASVEGKYSKSRIPESRSSLSGTTVNSSPRNSRKFPGVEHGRPALEDPSGPGTNGSLLPAKHFLGETFRDAPSHLSSSSISTNMTAPDESTERNRHRSDIVDIDNLHQMKRYYMTKYRKLEEFRGTNNRSSAEPNSEKTEPPAAPPPPARPLDPKQSRCLGDLTVPWCERSESGETTRQEDPRMLSARTCRVVSAPFATDLNPSGPGAEVSSRGRALSLPLPKFAHWTRTSSNDLDTRKRRLSVETSHLHLFSKPVCSAGILSPHHSPNPVKSDNVSFGFLPDSRTVDGITTSKTDGTADEVGAQSVVEPDKNCGKAEDSFTAETNIDDDEDMSSDVARYVGVDPETEPLDKPPVPETLETDLTGSCYLTVHHQNDQNGATDLEDSVASLVSESEKPGLSSKNDKPKIEGNCSDSVDRELKVGETKTICEDDILSNGKQLLDHCVKSSCDNFEPLSDVDVNSESSIRSSIHFIATAAANSNSCGEEVAPNKTETETELEADVDQSVADLDSAEKYLNAPSLNVAIESQEAISLVQGSGVSAVMSVNSLSTNDKTLNTDAENNICGFSQPDEGRGIEEFALVKRQDFDEKLVETEVKLGEDSCRTDDENGVHLKNKESVGSVNESVDESPQGDVIEKSKLEIGGTTVLPNIDESSEKPKVASMNNEKTTKNMHEIAGQKRKAGLPLESHNQTRRKNSSVDDAMNDPLSKRKLERGRNEEGEVPSLAKRPKFEDADVAKRQDASKAKEHGKSSKPDKSNHSSSKISSQSLKPSTHGHSTVKKDGSDRHTAHIPNSKPVDCGSDTRKKSSSSSDGTGGKRAEGPPHDAAETAGKSDFDLSRAHRKSSDRKDSKTSCSESSKSSNCVDKTCESRSTARHYEVRSDRSEAIHKLEKSCRNKSEKCGADQSRDQKVKHEVEPNGKGLADARTAEGKSGKSSDKDRENTKMSDSKSQKAREKSKDEKTSRVESASYISSDRKNSIVHSTSPSLKSSSSEKKSEHHRSHSAADMVKSGSTRKDESNSNSSLVSKGNDHSQDHRKHSQSAKHHPPDSCKPQDCLTKGANAAMEKKTSEHRIRSNCVSDHAKHSADIFSAGKVSNESGRNVERNFKNCTEPVKKDHKHSMMGISTENIGNNPSRTAYGKPSESLKQPNRSVLPAESDNRHHSRKTVPEPDARNSSRSRRESGGGTKREDKSTSKDKPSKAEYKEKLQNSREKCFSSLGHGAKPTQSSKKNESVVRRENEPCFAKNTDKMARASSVVRKDKSLKRPEEKRELKALLQEQDEELLLAPYMSMYDMVKRRSNKEREKEEAAKMEQLRSKTLDKLQVCHLINPFFSSLN